jgi:hypothetical protein
MPNRDVLQDQWTPLAAAASKCPSGAATVVRLLLDYGVEVNTPSQVMRASSEQGHPFSMSRNLSPITGVSASVLVATDPARFAFISVVFA